MTIHMWLQTQHAQRDRQREAQESTQFQHKLVCPISNVSFLIQMMVVFECRMLR